LNSALFAKERILLHRIGPFSIDTIYRKYDGSDERPLLNPSGFDYNTSLFTPTGSGSFYL